MAGRACRKCWRLAAFEPVSAANMAFGLCPLLTQDAIKLLESHGTPDQRDRLLRAAGGRALDRDDVPDRAAIRLRPLGRAHRAVPEGDAYRITGTKIFITYGEHELAENILHFVLARLPDAPPGSAGISLFAVPRLLPDGSRNAVRCAVHRAQARHPRLAPPA